MAIHHRFSNRIELLKSTIPPLGELLVGTIQVGTYWGGEHSRDLRPSNPGCATASCAGRMSDQVNILVQFMDLNDPTVVDGPGYQPMTQPDSFH